MYFSPIISLTIKSYLLLLIVFDTVLYVYFIFSTN